MALNWSSTKGPCCWALTLGLALNLVAISTCREQHRQQANDEHQIGERQLDSGNQLSSMLANTPKQITTERELTSWLGRSPQLSDSNNQNQRALQQTSLLKHYDRNIDQHQRRQKFDKILALAANTATTSSAIKQQHSNSSFLVNPLNQRQVTRLQTGARAVGTVVTNGDDKNQNMSNPNELVRPTNSSEKNRLFIRHKVQYSPSEPDPDINLSGFEPNGRQNQRQLADDSEQQSLAFGSGVNTNLDHQGEFAAPVNHRQQHENDNSDGYKSSSYHTDYSPSDRVSLAPFKDGPAYQHSSDEKHLKSIRVVFNNNPHFIIGSNPRDSLAPDYLAGSQPLHRRARQPSSLLYNDEYHSDESSLDETRIAAGQPRQKQSDVNKWPCDKQSKEESRKLPSNMEKVDLADKVNQQHQDPIPQQLEPPTKKSKPPPVPVEQQAKGDQDEQVDTPLDQMIKSGLRPPLRMVISMRNKHGEVMKVPINLHGSMRPPVQSDNLGTQMQIKIEHPLPVGQEPYQQQHQSKVDDNTPVGGDVFDPSIVKPFAKKSDRKMPRAPGGSTPATTQTSKPVQPGQAVENTPQTKIQVQTGVVQTPANEPIKPTASKRPDCHHESQAPDVANGVPTDEQKQENGPDDQQQQVVLPMSVDPNEGIVHMMVPKLAQFQSKTFANMFVQFQKAVQEQMERQLSSAEQQKPSEQTKQQQDEQTRQQQQDEQEDLMVAMVAANISQPSFGQVNKHMSMTVIRPPKGTTLQEAIMVHSKKAGPKGTVAILHSGPVSKMLESMVPNADKLDPGVAQRNGNDNSNGRPGIELAPVGIDVRLKPAGRPNLGTVRMGPPPVSDGSGAGPGDVDPDGFSSSIAVLKESLFDNAARRSLNDRVVARFKRHTPANQKSIKYGQLLEPADKLPSSQANKSARVDHRRLSGVKQQPSERAQAKGALSKVPKSKQESRVQKSGPDQRKRLKEPANAKQRDVFLAAASQQNELSSDSSDDDEPDEESEGSEGNEAEPSASVPSGESSSMGDDGDYGGDMSGDDFDDASGFDSDDEPYNQAASSERISDSGSFEIPQIDINPDTLQQKGCRTVLREVQEIPMNGLGVVQANGQPGSGYDQVSSAPSSSYHHRGLAGLRVKRQLPNENLINSRKVTSIVMTKECHFPNDSGKSAPAKPRASAPHSGDRKQSNNANQQHRQVDAVAFGNQGGASQMRQMVSPAAIPKGAIYQQPQGYLVNPYPANQYYSVIAQQPNVPVYKQIQTAPARTVSMAASGQRAHFVAPSGYQPQQQQQQQQQPQQTQRRSSFTTFEANQQQRVEPQSVRHRLEPGLSAGTGQPDQQATSPLRRRSVLGQPPPSSVPVMSSQLSERRMASNVAAPNHWRGPGYSKELYLGAASGRNEVVAQKLYKPPSEDDPFHTLSYSSQTGADPDMDQDEDDSVVMGPDDAGSESRQPGSRRSPASGPKRASETLSEREIEALADPNHDDTDPVIGGASHGNSRRNPDSDASDRQPDADESDSDLTDESRPEQHHRRPGGRSHVHTANNINQNQRAPLSAGPRTAPAPSPRPAAPRLARNQADSQRNQVKQNTISDQMKRPRNEPVRYGKSFKFEREVSRPQRSGLGSQLSHLKPGQQGFVTIDGKQQQVSASGIARQLQADRRQDHDPDEEDEADGDEDDAPGTRRHSDSSDTDEDPDADPEYNPKESHLPSHLKPKRVEKSFAYVHRDLPKDGSKNPDDFVVSYGRGNLQTEHEDYDSDRDNGQPVHHRRQMRRPAVDEQRAASTRYEQFVANPGRDQSGGQPIRGERNMKRWHGDDSLGRQYLLPLPARPILVSRWS